MQLHVILKVCNVYFEKSNTSNSNVNNKSVVLPITTAKYDKYCPLPSKY